VAQIVTRHVLAVLGEVRRKAQVRRSVQARDKTFDDRARDELERAYSRQDFGRQKACTGRLGIHCNHFDTVLIRRWTLKVIAPLNP
jgi:hypothetical protein